MNLKDKRFQQYPPIYKNSNLYTFLAVDSVRYVTSQVDMSDSHFMPLDIASTFVVCWFYEEVTWTK